VVKSAAAARRCEETTREEDLIDLLLLERAFPIVVIALVACALFVDIIIIVNRISLYLSANFFRSVRVRASEEILYINAALKCKLCKVVVLAVDMESEIRDVGGGTEEEGEESGRERAEREESLSKHLCASLLFFHFFLADLFFADFGHTRRRRRNQEKKKRIGSITRRRRLVTKPRALFAKKKKNRRGEKKKPREGRQFVLERAATRI